ncbi:SDR family oxidoreductase [Lactococcus taiwanensis]|uniref:SDR family oxidoreductase n=1 Tax=Lactococcus taiwanensis TaxID=1151742 RepID=UPI001907FB66|nr:SDR family NAD(P)-dependent oxidoreductase [Lactococcus taiwanensis]
MELKNNTILITGATSGIGLEMAKQLMNLDNTVIVTGRNKEKMESVKKMYPSLNVYPLDVTDVTSIHSLYDRLIKDFPKLNILINNAGLMKSIQFTSAKMEILTDEITTNLAGPILMIQTFLPHILRQKNSAILNVTSGIAYFPFDKAPLYSASKLGLHSYTQSLRKQLKKTNVKIFELAPPRTDKPMFSGSEEDNAQVDRIPQMPIEKVVQTMITGLKRDKLLILPGMSKLLRIIGKIQL